MNAELVSWCGGQLLTKTLVLAEITIVSLDVGIKCQVRGGEGWGRGGKMARGQRRKIGDQHHCGLSAYSKISLSRVSLRKPMLYKTL